MIHCMRHTSPLGELLLAADDHALQGVWFVDQKYVPKSFTETSTAAQSAALSDTVHWLAHYFSDKACAKLPPLNPQGTEFQQSVWQALLLIERGTTITYGHLARSIGRPKSTRAVAAAVGRNPISLLIPCHRVIGANGSLTGYAGGLERKQALLSIETGVKKAQSTA